MRKEFRKVEKVPASSSAYSKTLSNSEGHQCGPTDTLSAFQVFTHAQRAALEGCSEHSKQNVTSCVGGFSGEQGSSDSPLTQLVALLRSSEPLRAVSAFERDTEARQKHSCLAEQP